MDNLVFVKLGGSLITEKQQRYQARTETIRRLAEEIARARAAEPRLKLVLGHGSGSFGHVAARESGYDPRGGHPSPLALAQVGAAASALNHIVRAALLGAGVPALSLPPSASARLRGGKVVSMTLEPFTDLFEQDIVPLVYGDVALHADGQGGGIASTEMVFQLLAHALQPKRILLLGIVEGVLAHAPVPGEAIPPLLLEITPQSWEAIRDGLGGSHGTDVTGGMATKVAETLTLVQAVPGLQARIVSGEIPGLLERLLREPTMAAGTLLHTADE